MNRDSKNRLDSRGWCGWLNAKKVEGREKWRVCVFTAAAIHEQIVKIVGKRIAGLEQKSTPTVGGEGDVEIRLSEQ